MSGTRRFVDTNILLYAHDDSAGAKRDRARALPKQLWDSREGCLSVQVLQEFFMNATRKIPTPLSAETAKEIVADLSHWQHARPRSRRRACRDWHPPAGRISFRDSMIVRSAAEMGCEVLYSETSTQARTIPASARRTRSGKAAPTRSTPAVGARCPGGWTRERAVTLRWERLVARPIVG
jgi:predicted nucleic acid-binding protein